MPEPQKDPTRQQGQSHKLARQRQAVRARWNRLVNTPEAIADRRIRKWSELVETIILSVATPVSYTHLGVDDVGLAARIFPAHHAPLNRKGGGRAGRLLNAHDYFHTLASMWV